MVKVVVTDCHDSPYKRSSWNLLLDIELLH